MGAGGGGGVVGRKVGKSKTCRQGRLPKGDDHEATAPVPPDGRLAARLAVREEATQLKGSILIGAKSAHAA